MEIRLDHGRANVTVNHPAADTELLIDLPGGQVSLLKDGLYTFNADTNTVRVLRGEADAYAGGNSATKPITVHEDHELVLASANARAVELNDRRRLTADLLPGGGGMREGSPAGYPVYGPYGDGFYGGYPYAYPYLAWGYPYYGWGFGYGFGFGYYGGFRGGYGGFRGRR